LIVSPKCLQIIAQMAPRGGTPHRTSSWPLTAGESEDHVPLKRHKRGGLPWFWAPKVIFKTAQLRDIQQQTLGPLECLGMFSSIFLPAPTKQTGSSWLSIVHTRRNFGVWMSHVESWRTWSTEPWSRPQVIMEGGLCSNKVYLSCLRIRESEGWKLKILHKSPITKFANKNLLKSSKWLLHTGMACWSKGSRHAEIVIDIYLSLAILFAIRLKYGAVVKLVNETPKVCVFWRCNSMLWTFLFIPSCPTILAPGRRRVIQRCGYH